MTPQPWEKLFYPEGRYKDFKGYRVDRVIIQAALLFWIGVTAFFIWNAHPQLTSDLDYYECGSTQSYQYQNYDVPVCKNPFYEPLNWRNVELLTPGEYGNPNTEKTILSYSFITLGLYCLAFLLNHLIYNKGRK